jgi:hypothetical protein
MKKRVNISMSSTIREKASQLMQVHDFDDFSSYLEHLIRVDWERRKGDPELQNISLIPVDSVSDLKLKSVSEKLLSDAVSIVKKAKRPTS